MSSHDGLVEHVQLYQSLRAKYIDHDPRAAQGLTAAIGQLTGEYSVDQVLAVVAQATSALTSAADTLVFLVDADTGGVVARPPRSQPPFTSPSAASLPSPAAASTPPSPPPVVSPVSVSSAAGSRPPMIRFDGSARAVAGVVVDARTAFASDDLTVDPRAWPSQAQGSSPPPSTAASGLGQAQRNMDRRLRMVTRAVASHPIVDPASGVVLGVVQAVNKEAVAGRADDAGGSTVLSAVPLRLSSAAATPPAADTGRNTFTPRDHELVADMARVAGAALCRREVEIAGVLGTSAAQPLCDVTDCVEVAVCSASGLWVSGSGKPGTVRRQDSVTVTVRLFMASHELCSAVSVPRAPVVAMDTGRALSPRSPAASAADPPPVSAAPLPDVEPDPTSPTPSSLPQRLGAALWMRVARLPMAYRNLPVGAAAVFAVHTTSGVPVGWASAPLFDSHHVLASGQQRLRLWPGAVPVPPGSAVPTPPLPPTTTTPTSGSAADVLPTAALVVNFRSFSVPVVLAAAAVAPARGRRPSFDAPSSSSLADATPRAGSGPKPADGVSGGATPTTIRSVRSWRRVGAARPAAPPDGDNDPPSPYATEVQVGTTTPPLTLSPPPADPLFVDTSAPPALPAADTHGGQQELTNPLLKSPAAVRALTAAAEEDASDDAVAARVMSHLHIFVPPPTTSSSRRSSMASIASTPSDGSPPGRGRGHSDPMAAAAAAVDDLLDGVDTRALLTGAGAGAGVGGGGGAVVSATGLPRASTESELLSAGTRRRSRSSDGVVVSRVNPLHRVLSARHRRRSESPRASEAVAAPPPPPPEAAPANVTPIAAGRPRRRSASNTPELMASTAGLPPTMPPLPGAHSAVSTPTHRNRSALPRHPHLPLHSRSADRSLPSDPDCLVSPVSTLSVSTASPASSHGAGGRPRRRSESSLPRACISPSAVVRVNPLLPHLPPTPPLGSGRPPPSPSPSPSPSPPRHARAGAGVGAGAGVADGVCATRPPSVVVPPVALPQPLLSPRRGMRSYSFVDDAQLPTVSLNTDGRAAPPPPPVDDVLLAVTPMAWASMAPRVALIVSRDPLSRLSSSERRLLFACRHHLVGMSAALPKLLMSVDWGNADAVAEVYALLPQWRRPRPQVTLQLLGVHFADPFVRAYAVSCLEQLDDAFLACYMLQLVQALHVEVSVDSALPRFLLRRAVGSPTRMGHVFYWYVRAEVHRPTQRAKLRALLDAYLLAVDPAHRARVEGQERVMRQLQCVSHQLQSKYPRGTPMSVVSAEARRLLRGVAVPADLTLPLAPDMAVTGLDVDACRAMKSKKRPLWLEFALTPRGGTRGRGPTPGAVSPAAGGGHATTVVPSPFAAARHRRTVAVLFKVGDDLRQDQLTLQVLTVMDRLWKHAGLDLCLNLYGCVATGDGVGMLEVVRPSETIANIIRASVPDSCTGFKRTARAAYRALEAQACNQVKGGMEAAEENFARSAAGYCVATYVLGIGDRHNDNIMLTPDGKLFHIDFGHFLGNFKSKAGFKRERAPFVFTKSFAEIVGPVDGPRFVAFEALCCRAFQVLREHTSLLVTLFSLMTTCGMPELRREADIRWLRAKLMPGETVAAAEAMFRRQLDAAMRSWTTRFNDACHLLANG